MNTKKIKCFWDQSGAEYVQTEWAKPNKPEVVPVMAVRNVFQDENVVTILDKRSAKELMNELQRFIDS